MVSLPLSCVLFGSGAILVVAIGYPTPPKLQGAADRAAVITAPDLRPAFTDEGERALYGR